MELRQKRIDDETIQKVLDDDQADEQEILKELINRKRRQTRYRDDQKLIAYLARQGFNYSDIKDVMGAL
jgi:SOS response regulatory protein OraA/RecX